METQIIAVGGGFFKSNNLSLARYILRQSDNPEPSICLLATAVGDSASDVVKFYKEFSTLKCKPTHLPLFHRTPDLRKTLLSQDIVMVWGGNTKSMLAVWREWEIPAILQEASENGIILTGSSAGGICWFEQGNTDSWADRLEPLDCLGWLPGSCCPHYDNNSDARQETYKQQIKDKQIKPGLALDEGTGVHFKNGNLFKAVTSLPTAKVYQVNLEAEEQALEDIELLS
jgi:dipeptidase E